MHPDHEGIHTRSNTSAETALSTLLGPDHGWQTNVVSMSIMNIVQNPVLLLRMD